MEAIHQAYPQINPKATDPTEPSADMKSKLKTERANHNG